MPNTSIINGLSGLLIITSLMVIETRKMRLAAIYYALQSLVLVFIFLALAITMNAHQLYYWAGSAFITKVLLVPFILNLAQKNIEAHDGGQEEELKAAITPTASLAIAAVSLIVCFILVNQLDLKIAAEFRTALAVSVAHFFFGQLCILTQRNMLKQILGFCLMENGSHLTLALLAYNAPELVEIGIATDAVFGVLIMVLLVVQIYKRLHTLDASSLTSLKG